MYCVIQSYLGTLLSRASTPFSLFQATTNPFPEGKNRAARRGGGAVVAVIESPQKVTDAANKLIIRRFQKPETARQLPMCFRYSGIDPPSTRLVLTDIAHSSSLVTLGK